MYIVCWGQSSESHQTINRNIRRMSASVPANSSCKCQTQLECSRARAPRTTMPQTLSPCNYDTPVHCTCDTPVYWVSSLLARWGRGLFKFRALIFLSECLLFDLMFLWVAWGVLFLLRFNGLHLVPYNKDAVINLTHSMHC